MISCSQIKNLFEIVLLFLTLACGVTVQAQTWNKTFIEGQPLMIFTSAIAVDDGFIAVGATRDQSAPYNARIAAILVDSNGVVKKTLFSGTSSTIEYGTLFNNLISLENGKYALAGYLIDSVVKTILVQFNHSLDSFDIKSMYTPNTYAQYASALAVRDKGFYLCGVFTSTTNNDADIALRKLDSTGNQVWVKYYNGLTQDYAKSLIINRQGNLVVGAVMNDLDPTIEHSHTWILEIDTGGNLVRQWISPNDSTYAAEGLVQTHDGGYLFGSKKKSVQSGNMVAYTGLVVKLDSAFNWEWAFQDGFRSIYTGINDVQELADGSIIACGNKPSTNSDSSTLAGWVIKLSSTGGVLWSYDYRDSNWMYPLNFLMDVDVLENGDLILTGQCRNSGHIPPQVGWMIRLDSSGCPYTDCSTSVQKLTLADNLQIAPNPFHANVAILFPDTTNFISLTVVDMFGQILYRSQKMMSVDRRQQIDLGFLPSGVYCLLVEFDGFMTIRQLIKQ